MREIWMMQPRFERRSGSGVYTLVEQPRYRAGFDFLRLRADAGETDAALADWWEDFALGSEDDRAALIDEAREHEKKTRGPKVHQVARKPQAAAPAPRAATEEGEGEGEGVDAPDVPAKKRRRRRKPGGGGAKPAGASDAGA